MAHKESLKAETSLSEDLLKELSELPGITVLHVAREAPFGDSRIDMRIHLDCKGTQITLLAEIKTGSLQPKMALSLLNGQEKRIFVATSISGTTRNLLREHKTAYWDQSGSLYLELPNALYYIDKPPIPQPREERELKNPYRGASAQVLHALLLDPKREWKVTELAQLAKVSPYTSQQTLSYLEEQLWVQKSGKGPHTVRKLTQPGKILDSWASHHDLEKSYSRIRLHQFAKSPLVQKEQLRAFLGSQRESWALTLEHAAEAFAPFLTKLPTALTAIVPDVTHWSRLAENFGYREVEEGENLQLWVARGQAPFLGIQQHQELPTVSPVQLYLDLFAWPRRGKEQAHHLRETTLKY